MMGGRMGGWEEDGRMGKWDGWEMERGILDGKCSNHTIIEKIQKKEYRCTVPYRYQVPGLVRRYYIKI
jgi:hypothetical protein